MTPAERQQRIDALKAERAALAAPEAPAGGGSWSKFTRSVGEREDVQDYVRTEEEMQELDASYEAGELDRDTYRSQRKIITPPTLDGSDRQTGFEYSPRSKGATEAFVDSGFNAILLGQGDRISAKVQDISGAQPYESALGQARMERAKMLEEQGAASLAGEVTGFLAPGSVALRLGSKAIRSAPIISTALAKLPQGSRTSSKLVRYGAGPVASSAAAGAADYGLYRATVEASNLEATEGRDVGLGERAEMAKEGATDPLAFAIGPAASVVYRTARAPVTAAADQIQKARGAERIESAGRLTPTSRAAEVAEQSARRALPEPDSAEMSEARKTAYRKIYKYMQDQGVEPDDIREAMKRLSYPGGGGSVDEMLFELAGASNDRLAVALGSVGLDAQKIGSERLAARAKDSPARIREDLQKAIGLKGSDFYDVKDELAARVREEPEGLYDEAYSRTVSDATFRDRILPVLSGSPSARKAVSEAADYADDLGEREVAGELRAFQEALEGEGSPAKLSTKALDYVDRMLGDAAEGLRSTQGRRERARGPSGAQRAIRGTDKTGLDAETGLNAPRDLVAELKTAEEALEFGRKAFRNGTDLETLQREYAVKIDRYGGDNIESALLMGWLRGAEDQIAKATNPGTVIRQLYGSERQRQKLMDMLPSGEGLTAGRKGDQTKRTRALIGGTTDDGREIRSRIDREVDFNVNRDRIDRNSQTSRRMEAVEEEGRGQERIQQALSAIFRPRETAERLARFAANRVARPEIYQPEVNRELGDILFTSGKDDLGRILDEMESVVRKQTSKRPSALGSRKNEAGSVDIDDLLPMAGMVTGAYFGSQAGADYVGSTQGEGAAWSGWLAGGAAGGFAGAIIAALGQRRSRRAFSSSWTRGRIDREARKEANAIVRDVSKRLAKDNEALTAHEEEYLYNLGLGEYYRAANKTPNMEMFKGIDELVDPAAVERAVPNDLRPRVGLPETGLGSAPKASSKALKMDDASRRRRMRRQGYDKDFVTLTDKGRKGQANLSNDQITPSWKSDNLKKQGAVIVAADRAQLPGLRADAQGGSAATDGMERSLVGRGDVRSVSTQALGRDQELLEPFLERAFEDPSVSFVRITDDAGKEVGVVARNASVLRDPKVAKFEGKRKNERSIFAGAPFPDLTDLSKADVTAIVTGAAAGGLTEILANNGEGPPNSGVLAGALIALAGKRFASAYKRQLDKSVRRSVRTQPNDSGPPKRTVEQIETIRKASNLPLSDERIMSLIEEGGLSTEEIARMYRIDQAALEYRVGVIGDTLLLTRSMSAKADVPLDLTREMAREADRRGRRRPDPSASVLPLAIGAGAGGAVIGMETELGGAP